MDKYLGLLVAGGVLFTFGQSIIYTVNPGERVHSEPYLGIDSQHSWFGVEGESLWSRLQLKAALH
jgi:hypothetical protein